MKLEGKKVKINLYIVNYFKDNILDAKGRKGQGDLADEKALTQQEREKIIEVLLS